MIDISIGGYTIAPRQCKYIEAMVYRASVQSDFHEWPLSLFLLHRYSRHPARIRRIGSLGALSHRG
jgi:hypothetical protein